MSDAKTFNPQDHLTKVGPSDYLPVMWRIVWFRERNPHGSIRTELVEHAFGEYAVFKATVVAGSGDNADDPYATGYGSETIKDFRDYLEKAETKAIGRALAALGYGTAFSAQEFGGEAEAGRIVDSPIAPNLPARGRTTSQNTIPEQSAEAAPQRVENWTDFWTWARTFGLADKAMVEKAIGGTLSHDPGFAYEKLMAWRAAATYQPAMPS